MASRDIVVRIITDLAALRSGMQQATGVIAGAASKAQGLSNSLGGIERAARTAGIQLALIGGVGVAAFGKATATFNQYEETLARTVGLTSLTKEEVDKVKAHLEALAPVVGIGPNALAEAFYFAVSAVGDTDKALRILDVSSRASTAGLGDLSVVVDGVSSAVNAYGENVLSAERATDIFVSAVKEGKMPPEAFAGSIGKVLPIASALGVSFEEVAANMAVMTRVGMNADESATALKATMTQLLKPSSEAEELLGKLGLTFDDLRKSLSEKGLLATLQDMIELTGGEVDQLAILFPNVRALTDVLGSAVAQGDTYVGILERTNNAAGLTNEAFATMQETTGFATKQLKAQLEILAITIGSVVAPVLANFIQSTVIPFVTALKSWMDENPRLARFLILFGAIGSAVALVAGGFLLFVSVVAGGLKVLVDLAIVMPKVATAMANLASALARGVIHAGEFAIKMAGIGWDALRTSISKTATQMWRFTRGLQAAIRSDSAKLKVNLDQAFGTKQVTGAEKAGVSIGSAIRGALKGSFQGLGIVAGSAIAQAFKPQVLLKAAGGAITGAATAIAGMFQSVMALAMANPLITAAIIAAIVAAFLIYKYRDQIWDALLSLFDILQEFFTQAVPNWFRQNFTAANVGRIVGMAAGILIIAMFPIPFLIIKFREQIMGFLAAIPELVADIPGKIAAFVGDHWEEILIALWPVPGLIIKFREEIAAFLAGVAGFVAGIPGKIAAFVGDHWEEILIALFPVPGLVVKFREEIAAFLVDIATFVAGLPGKIAAFIGDNWKEIIGALIDVPKWSIEFGTKAEAFVEDILPRIPGWFASIGTAIAGAIKDAFLSLLDFDAWLKTALSAAWNKLPGPVKDFLGGVGGGFGAVMDWAGLQKGVLNFIGGMALVGEHGPELMRLPAGTDVVRNENMRQAIRDLDGSKTGGNFNLAVNIAANFGNWAELRRQIMEDVEEQLDDAAARAGLSQPRFGTLGAGVPRT
jgi:TP901 family phage tail tape measure protein